MYLGLLVCLLIVDRVLFSRTDATDSSAVDAITCVATFVELRTERGSPPRHCRRVADKLLQTAGNQNNVYSPACQYTLKRHALRLSPALTNDYYLKLMLTVSQHRCSNGSARTGASLRLDIASKPSLSCPEAISVGADNVFTCTLNISSTSPPRSDRVPTNLPCNSVCDVPIAVTLDYERGEAFDSVHYGLGKAVLQTTLNEVRLVASRQNKIKLPRSQQPVCCTWTHCESAQAVLPKLPAGILPGEVDKVVNTANSLPTSAGIGHPNRADSKHRDYVKKHLSQYAAVYFVGPSHMRYLWDTMAVRYLNATGEIIQHPQHHGDLSAENTWYVSVHFAMELPGVVGEICAPQSMYAPPNASQSDGSTNPKPVVFVFQVGSWDLDYYPVGDFLAHPNSTSAVTALVHRLSQPGNTCLGRPTRVIWLTDVPIPECPTATPAGTSGPLTGSGAPNTQTLPPTTVSDRGVSFTEKTSCFNKGYRNNYAIAAANRYFLDALQPRGTTDRPGKHSFRAMPAGKGVLSLFWGSLGMRASSTVEPGSSVSERDSAEPSLTVVDAFGIVYPHRQHHTCGLHYLCCKHNRAKDGLDLLITPGGGRLLDVVMAVLLTHSEQNPAHF
jgi:hypothetical protein